jgi:hypothetical protein
MSATRLSATVLAVGHLLVAAAAPGEPNFPYRAVVSEDEVYVRSGPGKSYYPTDKLRRGQEVEVHRHDPGGWYAIRPPRGSFTWVSARYLQKKEKGLAVVTSPRVAARVGSCFSDIRDVVQVRLDKGELVEILGEKQFGAGSESGTWYKIAPPSGEFRWVFGKYVASDFDPDRRQPAPVERAAPAASGAAGGRETGPSGEPPKGTGVSVDPRRFDPGAVTREGPRSPPAPLAPAALSAAALPRQTVVTVTPEVPLRRMSPEEFQAELDAADLQLSVMLAEEPTVWEFGELDTKAQTLLAQAETAVERGRARLLAGKIAQAADIKRRTNEIQRTQVEIEGDNRRLAGLAEQQAAAMRASSQDRFDGVGRLTRVVPSKLGAPRYALVDERGAVRCYVTPAPDVNIRYYEGRLVGVNGIRGYISRENAEHITAKHIAPLDDPRWR